MTQEELLRAIAFTLITNLKPAIPIIEIYASMEEMQLEIDFENNEQYLLSLRKRE